MNLNDKKEEKVQKNKRLRIQALSDLHLEHRGHPAYGTTMSFIESLKTDADVLVLAGDITAFGYFDYTFRAFCKLWPNVVYVAGNHDYYHSSFDEVHKKLTELSEKIENFHWLDGCSVTIDGQKFVGGTLWFPENEHSLDPYLQQRLSDFLYIKDIRKTVFKSHDATRDFIAKEAREDTIVVTHHFPHEKCIDPKFKNDLTNCFFYAEMDKVIELCQPKLWISGHTHSSFDFHVDKTRLVCNPYGYVDYEVNKQWKNNLVVEV